MPVRIHTSPIHFYRKERTNAVETNGLFALGLHRILTHTGAGLLGLFLPIFLFHLFQNDIRFVLAYGLLYYLLAGIFEPLGAMIMTRIGLPQAMRLGTVFYILFFGILASKNLSVSVVAFGSLAALVIWHVIYWIPYHTEFAESANPKRMGRAVGTIAAVSSCIGMILPIISGSIITMFGYSILFLIAAGIIFSSAIPLGRIRAIKERYEYTFMQTFRELFHKKHRRFLFIFAAEGAESVVGFLVWPVFLFEVLGENYIQTGIITALVTLLSILLQMTVGKWIDSKPDNQKLLKTGMSLTSLGWIIKAFVHSMTQVIFAGTFHSLASILMRTPFEALMYTKAADAGHYVDEYTVLREMALCTGRVIILGVFLLLSPIFDYWIAFLLTALVTFAFERLSAHPPTLQN
ncbi:MAG: hypothetical protein UU48_C0004G0047 [Candidatus Uhrbacteria bacterium GW2011_GWF2_41_16]|uniref:Major facilitator superfamily n=2 Tax=Candidatus Uhriibacteriota TaxID=1752732 RepID=A0A0G0VBI9_9BACT|nr:MAG: hypothetical protein UU35_C0013G0019 [Candidatus Uhrbacteria bacterium GW2011_GWC2_41_11]KKR98254.1 MAG: hypothetical protein UU48_C0004G0047 [Candidatus Uhrbacteria bacterium GW2011_GWF2_41_16]